jgi:hypothetical protein
MADTPGFTPGDLYTPGPTPGFYPQETPRSAGTPGFIDTRTPGVNPGTPPPSLLRESSYESSKNRIGTAGSYGPLSRGKKKFYNKKSNFYDGKID